MDLSYRLNHLSQKKRHTFYSLLSQFGYNETVLNTTKIIYNDKHQEILSNEQIIIWIELGGLNNTKSIQLFAVGDIVSCYHSRGDFADGTIGLILAETKPFEIRISDYASSILIYNSLREIIGSKKIEYGKELLTKRFVGCGAHYLINSKELIIEKCKAFSSIFYISKRISPISDILWCNQNHGKTKSSDYSFLNLYLIDGSVVKLETTSIESAFALYLEIKKSVPHLLYGPNQEYEKIFKMNPNELMALAKSMMSD